jgi:hypothetical protein
VLNHIINYISLAFACLSCTTGNSNNEFLARKWIVSIHSSVEEQQKRKDIPHDTRNNLDELSNSLYYGDTTSIAYKSRLRLRISFINFILNEDSKIFDNELLILEFPLSGEIASNNFFMISKIGRRAHMSKYVFNEGIWHFVSKVAVNNLNTDKLFTTKRCYKHGANTDPMNAVMFRNHGNNVSAQHYPPNSYCGELHLFYSM